MATPVKRYFTVGMISVHRVRMALLLGHKYSDIKEVSNLLRRHEQAIAEAVQPAITRWLTENIGEIQKLGRDEWPEGVKRPETPEECVRAAFALEHFGYFPEELEGWKLEAFEREFAADRRRDPFEDDDEDDEEPTFTEPQASKDQRLEEPPQ